MLIDDQKPGVIFRGQDVSAQSESRAASAYQQYAEPPPYESFQRTRSTSSGSYAAQQPTRSPNSQLPYVLYHSFYRHAVLTVCIAFNDRFPPELSSSSVDDTVPVSFSRQPPPHLLHTTPFPPIFLIAKGHHLDKGFPICPPPSKFQPHPFTTHDVNEGDWTRWA
jgi:hypothetical protein